VSRVDEGWAVAKEWAGERILLELEMKHFKGLVRLVRVNAAAWRAEVIAGDD
jgi:hypothetical protein